MDSKWVKYQMTPSSQNIKFITSDARQTTSEGEKQVVSNKQMCQPQNEASSILYPTTQNLRFLISNTYRIIYESGKLVGSNKQISWSSYEAVPILHPTTKKSQILNFRFTPDHTWRWKTSRIQQANGSNAKWAKFNTSPYNSKSQISQMQAGSHMNVRN